MPDPLANPSTTQEGSASSVHEALAPFDAPVPLRLWHLTSLDAPTVAVVWSLSFAWAVGVDPPRWVPLLLALGTWCVYVGDRLLDARTAMHSNDLCSLRERHFFHWYHRRLLVPLACGSAAFAAAIVFSSMPIAIRERNSVLAFAALAYFSGVHLPRIRPKSRAPLRTKEFLVGVLFTVGCASPVFVRMHSAAGSVSAFLVLGAFFAALAWLNCNAIDRWESAGSVGVLTMAFSLAAVGLLLAVAFLFHHPRISAMYLAGAASAALLGTLDVVRGRLTPLALRCAADLVLLTPMLCLFR